MGEINKESYRMLSTARMLDTLAQEGEFLCKIQNEETLDHIKKVLDSFAINYTLSRQKMDIKIRMKGSLAEEYM